MQLFNKMGATRLAAHLKTRERNVYARRRSLEAKYNATIPAPSSGEQIKPHYPGRTDLSLQNGTVLVGSDFHIWPGEESTCLRAFKKFIDDIKPNVVILNGDVTDFPRISRFPQNWERAPDVWEELEAVQDHLNDMVQRCKRGTQKFWTLGNHDARFETLIANAAPQLKNVKGVHLSDHFAVWQKAMSCMINDGISGGATMIKHRWKGGIHATHNNTVNAGISMVTGHLHSAKVTPFSDYQQYDRYGVDSGCVADKHHRAFSYTEDSPLNWRSAFALLTYRDGRLMFPELISKWDENSVQFRGEVITV